MESSSSIAADVDIVCMRGDTFTRTLKFWQDPAKTTPIDITSDVYRMQVRYKNRSTPILSFEIGEGLSITPPNVLELGKDAKEMAGLPVGNFDYDIERDTDDVVTTIITGIFTIQQDYTL